MPVVKGGVWTNIEDEILKAAISKYGLNQWARVSSLLARKTAKQCKARWDEWLDPAIKKIEWSREEDEQLLHLAKLMPTQWRTIAPIVGRTANQCLERYNKLLDEAQAKEDSELGLTGVGAEASAPTADDVRRLRPGEVDPDPETKPARPDTIDLDEDEKEMLSEARARLANTQGKKAKRKARERQLEESRRVASLQKRRELKMSGINTKLAVFKKGEMNYNADIPFERAPVPGFYDTSDEKRRNEAEKKSFDPRKQQLAAKRKGDQQEDENQNKKRKSDKQTAPNAGFQAAMKAAQAQKIREAEQMSKRKSLVLPAPQVSDAEMQEIVKMGVSGERVSSKSEDSHGTQGLVGNYSAMPSATPIRTPMAAPEEDRIANEIANIRALNETQSALLGGENSHLVEGSGSTGFGGVKPSQQTNITPNPMATPFRQANGVAGPSATPFRTPRDNLSLNKADGMALVGQTPREFKMHEKEQKQDLASKLKSLPKPKETEWELELPEERDESAAKPSDDLVEDASLKDRRQKQMREAAELADFKSQTFVIQNRLPRPKVLDVNILMKNAEEIADPIRRAVAIESALLMANDGVKFGECKVIGRLQPPPKVKEDLIEKAKSAVANEVAGSLKKQDINQVWSEVHNAGRVPGLEGFYEDEIIEHQMMVETLDSLQENIMATASKGNELEKKLNKLHGGYLNRSKMLRTKISETSQKLEDARRAFHTHLEAQGKEERAILRRLEQLREDVGYVTRREREEQEIYRSVQEELRNLEIRPKSNGVH